MLTIPMRHFNPCVLVIMYYYICIGPFSAVQTKQETFPQDILEFLKRIKYRRTVSRVSHVYYAVSKGFVYS